MYLEFPIIDFDYASHCWRLSKQKVKGGKGCFDISSNLFGEVAGAREFAFREDIVLFLSSEIFTEPRALAKDSQESAGIYRMGDFVRATHRTFTRSHLQFTRTTDNMTGRLTFDGIVRVDLNRLITDTTLSMRDGVFFLVIGFPMMFHLPFPILSGLDAPGLFPAFRFDHHMNIIRVLWIVRNRIKFKLNYVNDVFAIHCSTTMISTSYKACYIYRFIIR